jgi:DNA polymerase-1
VTVETITHRLGGWPCEDVTINVARTSADMRHLSDWLFDRRDHVLGLDFETNARDPWHRGFRARTAQFADTRESWVVVLPDGGPGSVHQDTSELIRRHPRWTAHFSEADIRFAMRGIPHGPSGPPIRFESAVPHVSDTQTVLAVYDPRTVTTFSKKDRIHPAIPRLKGLKDNVGRLLTPGLKTAETELYARFRELAPVGHRTPQKSKTWGFANIPDDDPAYLVYAGLDPLCGVRMWYLMRHELEKRGQWGRTEAALIEQWMVDQGTYRGLQIDGPYARWLSAELIGLIKRNAAYLLDRGIGESGQGPSVGRAFVALGVPDGGSWDRTVIGALVDHPDPRVTELARAVSAVRRAGKFGKTYISPMLRALDDGDGAMHPSVRAVGTVTTRMSAQKTESAGPVQQLPKKDPRVRAAVRARRGHVLVTADFSQGEPFTMAALSGDAVYLRDLMAGDINSTIAALVYGDAYVPAEGKVAGTSSYLMRQKAKAAWLAFCYSAGPRKIAETLGVPEEHGFAVVQTWRGRYAALAAFSDRMNHLSVIHLDSGHRVPLWDRVHVDDATGALIVGPRPSRLGLNAATQGTQSDLLRVAMHRLHRWGWTWAFRFALHDELLLEVPEPLAEQARQVLERAMTVTYRGVTLHCEAVIEGRTWMPQPSEFNPHDLPDLDDAA